MERVVPWAELERWCEPHYPKGGNGRPPVGLSIMLRIYFLQQWFNLSDPAVEEALYESPALRRFAGVDLGRAPAPDETTICNFRHLLEQHELGGEMLDAVNCIWRASGIRIATGTIVDATIIHAPSSTKNASGERDPEMHQTRKGKQWYFGMKAHIGVDSQGGHGAFGVHHVRPRWPTSICCPTCCTARNGRCGATAAIKDRREAIREAAPHAQDMTCRRTRYKKYVDELQRGKNRVSRECEPKWSIRSAS